MTLARSFPHRSAFSFLVATVLALGACAPDPARPPSAAPQSPAEIERTLVAQADAWDKAIVRKDRAAVEGNVAPGFFHIGGDASVEDRATFLQGLLDPELTINPYVVEGLTFHLYGSDTALLSATTHMTGTYKGKPFASNYRYIDTYVRYGARWQIVAVQITRLPAAPPSP